MENKVGIYKVSSYSDEALTNAVENLFCALPCTAQITAETKILLKPNLVAKHPPESAVTTHPAVLRAVILACKKRGAKAENITVADSSGGIYNHLQIKSYYKTAGWLEVCKEQNVLAYDECKWQNVSVENGKAVSNFDIIEPVLNADFIINLPKFKTHMMTGLTAATKNLFGVIPGLQKAQWHVKTSDKARFGDMLIDLLQTVKPDLHILDAVVGMEGDGPAGGEPRNVGFMLGSENALNLDLAVASLMSLEAKRVPYLKSAIEQNLCAEKFDENDLFGDVEAFSPLLNWKLAQSYSDGDGANVDFSAHAPRFLRPVVRAVERTFAPYPAVRAEKCVGCAKCAEICPQHIITLKDHKATIHPRKCIRCFCCHEMCPVKAIDLKSFGRWQG